jgi:hypothetical protein
MPIRAAWTGFLGRRAQSVSDTSGNQLNLLDFWSLPQSDLLCLREGAYQESLAML